MSHEWERLAALTGGTVSDLAVAGAGRTFAATSGGVFWSGDGGTSWAATSSRDGPSMIEAVAPSPCSAEDSTIFAGSNLGLHRSRDAGNTWQSVLSNGHVRAVRVSPGYARDNLVLAGTDADGILRSEDGGQHWTGANPGLLDLSITALAMSPTFDLDHTCFAATMSGLYRSRNGGKSWRAVESMPDEATIQCVVLSPTFADDQLVLAGTEGSGLWRSEDAGATWEDVPALAGRSVLAAACSSRFPKVQTIVVATDNGIYVSLDGGDSWRRTGHELGPVLSVVFVPSDQDEVLIAGLAREGITRSADTGATWRPANRGLHARLVVGLTPSPTFLHDQILLASDLHFGALLSTDAGSSWTTRNDGLDDTSVASILAIAHGVDDPAWYTATGSGVFRRRPDAAAWQRLSNDGHVPTTGAIAVGPSANGGSAVVIAALRGGGLLELDGDNEWRSLGQPFQRADVVSLALSPGYAKDRTLWAITSSIGSGPRELVLWHSANGGADWDQWLASDGHPLLSLAIAPTYAISGTVFAGIGNRVMQPIRNSRELRGGSPRPRWRGVTLGSASTVVTALALSPGYRADKTVYAATSSGVFVSRDRGDTFREWTGETGPTSIVALAVAPSHGPGRSVYAVELGGMIWRRHDE